jgi:hypothetical protein
MGFGHVVAQHARHLIDTADDLVMIGRGDVPDLIQPALDAAQSAFNAAQATFDAAQPAFDATQATFDGVQPTPVLGLNRQPLIDLGFEGIEPALENAEPAFEAIKPALKPTNLGDQRPNHGDQLVQDHPHIVIHGRPLPHYLHTMICQPRARVYGLIGSYPDGAP